ncbi:MAG: DUF1624 domain-containing protein [Spirochaetes bacterium]|nr:DUF1624 domain-containing protein [Spirochaetota bacterium]MBU0956384.1 DUF1624 domain-containing protein [Spirochaetota bacterium]
MSTKSVKPRKNRLPLIDQLRGLAVIGMVLFHALYMLVMQGLLVLDLWSGFWWWFARGVAALFVLLAGWSMSAKKQNGSDWRFITRRVGILGAAALLVSLVTIIAFGPQYFVFFGVLHLLAVGSIVGWPLANHSRTALFTGLAVLVLGLWLGSLRFDFVWLAWLGLRSSKLRPMDYLPLLPWFAWLCFGMAAYPYTRLLAAKPSTVQQAAPASKAGPGRATATAAKRCLEWLGQHSLLIYLVHLPLLYGLSLLLAALLRPPA